MSVIFKKNLYDITKVNAIKAPIYLKQGNYVPAIQLATPSRILPNGKYQLPIKKVTIGYSNNDKSSTAIREFILKSDKLTKLIDEHKYIEWEFLEKSGHPTLKFYYLPSANGLVSGIKDGMKVKCIKNLKTSNDILNEIQNSLNERGFKKFKYKPQMGVVSDKLSIRGVWSPFHSK
ncbi:hypothetical protein ACO0SA_003471 [Hanseniaspora valbyensis]